LRRSNKTHQSVVQVVQSGALQQELPNMASMLPPPPQST
jgi:hypothetical protein